MGEYAKYNGEQIKIGTCEQMYYLRADQVRLVSAERGSVDPHNRETAGRIRFRFPFPDEDTTQPGAFIDYQRSLFVYGVEAPEGVDHGTLQFTRNYPTSGGIILSTPCPESAAGKASGLKFHHNGYSGKVGINSQRLIDGKLKLVCSCGSCGCLWRYDTLEDCAPILAALEQDAKSRDHETLIANQRTGAVQCTSAGTYYREVARRIVAGYTQPNYWTPMSTITECELAAA